MNKENIKFIYATLKGYHKTLVESKESSFYNSIIWDDYNDEINELNNLSGKTYSKFKIEPEFQQGLNGGSGYYYIKTSTFKFKLSGLLARLHDEYFPDDQDPFSVSPSTIINQTQNQAIDVKLLLDINSIVDKKIDVYKNDSQEGKFLGKIKNALSSVTDINKLLQLILKTGVELGLTAEMIYKIFK